MPKYYKKNLLFNNSQDGEKLIESPLHTPELPEGHFLEEPGSWEIDPVKTLISWKAPARPFRKRHKSFYFTSATLVILIALIVLLMGQIMLLAVIFAFTFVFYVLNFVEPEEVEYKLSTQGVTIGDHFYHWQELDSFWFSKKDGSIMLHILTNIQFPSVLILTLGSATEEEVKNVTARYLPFHEIAPKSAIDKWGERLQKHFSLENPHNLLK